MKGIRLTGVIPEDELSSPACKGVPTEDRYARGPVAVIECIEEIPCNPCELSCPRGAIKIGYPITNLPCLDEEKCIGCGLCIAKCPGLAIFVEDRTYSEEEALVSFPFEFVPLPEEGSFVRCVDRTGKTVCEAVIHRVEKGKQSDQTVVITVRVKKDFAHSVRSIERG